MNTQQSEATQYDRLVDVMSDLRERSRRIIREAQLTPRPKLVFVYGQTDGQSRRVEGFVAQVLQRRHNHETFELIRVCADEQPDLVERLGVSEVPTLLVVDGRRVGLRLKRPKGVGEIEAALSRWLS